MAFKHILKEKQIEEAEANEAASDAEAALRQAEKVRVATSQCIQSPIHLLTCPNNYLIKKRQWRAKLHSWYMQ